MLRKFTVNNFKSLINVTYEPGVVNLLVGRNNSGKTNLCQALRFLSWTAREQESVLRAWKSGKLGQVRNVYFEHPTVDLGCDCDLIIDDETVSFHYSLSLLAVPVGPIRVERERLQASGRAFGSTDITLLENDGGKVRLLNEQRLLKGSSPDSCYQDTTVERQATMLSRLHDRLANGRAIAFRDYLSSWLYYDLDVPSLREDRFELEAYDLNSNGSNLASVLFRLKTGEDRWYRRLIQLAQTIEPRLDALNFTTTSDRIEIELTDPRDHRFRQASASNGTLRFLALCYIVLNNARQSNPALTIIEEPENSLYVRHLKPLFELIDPSGTGGQYIFTSHSPYFIDLFENQLDNITVMQDRGTHSALSKPDPGQLRKYLEEMPPGELHFREMLA
ncbi:MAG: AAA family ATPase [Bacteroidota bacterium]